jgi:hypothetical protein
VSFRFFPGRAQTLWMVSGAVSLALLAALGSGCDPWTIEVVGSPGGVYRPGQGCTLAPGAPVCPAPGQPHAQLDFESEDAARSVGTDTAAGTLANLRVTCTRSYCGSGSLEADSVLQWSNNDANDPLRMASFAYTFDPPVDLMNHTIGFSVSTDHLGVPMHAQIGVIYQYWRWIGWSPLSSGWNQIEGVVSPANPLTKIDPTVTSIPVTEIRMDVYVPVADASGTQGSWSGEIFLDDVSW